MLVAPVVQAQQDQPELQAGYFMLNQYVCPLHVAAEASEQMQELMVPVWRELQNEGLLRTAGFLTHDWGDEWNVNFYMVTEDRDTFFQAWGELMSRLTERYPGWFERIAPLCTMHKDNLYNVHSID